MAGSSFICMLLHSSELAVKLTWSQSRTTSSSGLNFQTSELWMHHHHRLFMYERSSLIQQLQLYSITSGEATTFAPTLIILTDSIETNSSEWQKVDCGAGGCWFESPLTKFRFLKLKGKGEESEMKTSVHQDKFLRELLDGVQLLWAKTHRWTHQEMWSKCEGLGGIAQSFLQQLFITDAAATWFKSCSWPRVEEITLITRPSLHCRAIQDEKSQKNTKNTSLVM